MTEPSPLQRLNQRRLVKSALPNLAVAFVGFQLLEVRAEPWGIFPPVQRVVHLALLMGLFIPLVLAGYNREKG